MTDVTAQAFREVAAYAKQFDRPSYPSLERLLLAAAEQREQLDAALARIEKLDEWLLDREVVLTERDNAVAQIATLTAERDEALKADILYMAREAGNEMPPEEALAKLRTARIESEES